MSDTSTRSGMLWEVERILTECKELNTLPQILLMENVPQIHSSDNTKDFLKWQIRLEELGYKSYWQDLIATDYGIPQTRNRCFMISILGDYSYTFPKPIPLKLKLKDVLEDNVDEKYYLSDKMLDYCFGVNQKDSKFPRKERFLQSLEQTNDKNIATTITTNAGNRPTDNFIKIKNATKKGYLEATEGDGVDISSRMQHHRGTVQRDKIQTITTSGGNDRGVVVDTLKKDLCNKLIQEGLVEEGDVVKHSYTQQILEGNKKCVEKNDGNMITLTTRGDCVGVCVNDNLYYGIATNESKEWQKEPLKEKSRTLLANKSNAGVGVIETNLRIRKLTPKECFRLMGVKDEDYEKCAKNQSDSSLYHLAGDSIVCNVLMAIFKELF